MDEKDAVRVYLALGSNMGERKNYLEQAIQHLPPQVRVLHTSSVYETEPWGYEEQPAFLNQVIEAQTTLSPLELLAYLKEVEDRMGREETFRYGPRVIDIDILFYEDLTYADEELQIPHPRITERAFVLVPLAEIAPDLIHPELGESIRELLRDVDQQGVEPFVEQES